MATPRILGLPFRSGVTSQINTRQSKLSNLNRWGTMVSGSRVGQPDELVVFESATSFVRLSSAVSVDGPERLNTLYNNLGISQGNISGYNLAKNLVLWGGVNIQNNPSMLGAQTSDYYGLNSSYGFLSDGGQGLKPMPGITSMTSTYKNNGSLKEAVIQIKCFTRKQFEAIEAVYLRLGYTMVLEWGHTDYFKNDGNRGSLTAHSILDKLFTKKDVTAEEIQNQLEKNKQNTSFNYDGILARVTNFNWTLNSDLSYDITLYLISWGDIIDSLKVNTNNNASSTSTTKYTTESLPTTLFGIEIDDPLAIPQGLVNILNNKSLSTLNSLFFDMYEVLIKSNVDSFDEETKEIIKDLDKQATEQQYIPKVNAKVVEWINEYKSFTTDYGTGTNTDDITSINNFSSVLNNITSEVNAINDSVSFSKYWGVSAKYAYDNLLDPAEPRGILYSLKSKIISKYKSPNSVNDTGFEDYLQNTISYNFRINL